MKSSKTTNIMIIKIVLRMILVLSLIYNIIFVIGHEFNDKFNIVISGTQLIPITEKTMEPAINKNDLVVVKQNEIIKEKDVIAFYNNDSLKIKRIIKIEKSGNKKYYTTKGDNNLYVDPDKTEETYIEGKIVGRIRFLGLFIRALRTKWMTAIITLILILSAIYNRNMQKKEERRKKLRELRKNRGY